MSAKEILTELNKNGWKISRIRGSHYIFVKNGESLTLPYHKTVKKGILDRIRKQVAIAELKNKYDGTVDPDL